MATDSKPPSSDEISESRPSKPSSSGRRVVERILEWLASPVVRAQDERLARTARVMRRSQRASQRLDRMVEAYRRADDALHR